MTEEPKGRGRVRTGGMRWLGTGAAVTAMMVGLVGGALDTVASSAAKIRLATSLTPVLQSSAEGIRFAAYTVTVRSTGGTARNTRLAITTQRPAQWSIFPPTCQASEGQSVASKNQDARLKCALGEVTGSANPKAPVPPITPAPVVPKVPFMMPEAAPVIGVPQLPAAQLPAAQLPTAPQPPAGSPNDGGAQKSDNTSPMSLTTVPPLTDGQGSWARTLAVVVVAEAAVLWLAASLGLWRRRRLLLGQAVGNGVRYARLLRPAATMLCRAPLPRLRPGARKAALGRRLRLRRW